MKRLLFACSMLVLLARGERATCAEQNADGPRPVVVVSVSSYGELKGDLDYLGTLSGQADLAASLERLLLPFASGREFSGLDQERPWGGALEVTDDGSRFFVLAFLPVDDLNKFLGSLEGIKSNDVGDGVYEVEHDGRSYFMIQQGKWAYAARRQSDLKELPADPLGQFQGLHERYDLAFAVNPQNVPPGVRGLASMIVGQRLSALRRLQRQTGGEQDDRDAEPDKGISDELLSSLGEINRVTLGLNVDRTNGHTSLELQIAAAPESNTAKLFAAVAEPRSSPLAGIALRDSIFSFHVNAPLSEAGKKQTETWLNGFRNRLTAEIDNERDEDLDDEQRTKVKQLAAKVVELLQQTAEKDGRLSAGLAVIGPRVDAFEDMLGDAIEQSFPNRVHETIIGAGRIIVVAGGAVADGAEWEKAMLEVVTLVAAGAGEDPPKLNVENFKGWRFHTLSYMAPQTMRAEPPLRILRNLLGNPLKIVVAFGDHAFYVAVGGQGAEAIKKVIDRSTQMSADKLPPLTASVELAHLTRLIASEGRNATAAKIAAGFERSGNNHVTLTIEPVAGGIRCRLEGEESASRLLCVVLGRAAGLTMNLNSLGGTAAAPREVTTKTPDGATTTTTTTDNDGTTTVTRTETSGNGGQSSRRQVTVVRRGPPRGRRPGTNAKQPTELNKAGEEKKGAEKPPRVLRTWSSKNGKYKVEARLVEIDGDSVKLQTDGGERLTIAIEKLSDDDQKLARQLAEEFDENPFKSKDDED